MSSTLKKPAAALVLVLAGALVVAAPGFVLAYTLIGGSLGLGTSGDGYQRDIRVWNNSTDPASNSNVTPEASYPGALGAVLAVWKAGKGWASENTLASKNFDFDFQGTTTSSAANTNTVGWGSAGCGGGTLAYCETPIDNGWRIVMCDSWTWDDGPGAVGGNDDIQGVATHELGHALGLGHAQDATFCSGSCSTNSTMCAFICSNGESERTVTADDAGGLQAIYGAKPANKPLITSLSGSLATGGTLVINGSNFAASVNVKFTAGTGTNTGVIPGVVYGVASAVGGTQVSVVIPATAQDGNVIVWEPSLGLMSNAFPINVNFVPPPPPSISSFSPSSVEAYQGGVVTVTGTGFVGATQMNIGGTLRTPPAGFQILNDTTITFTAATATALGPVSVTVTSPNGTSAPMSFNYVATTPAILVTPGFALSNSIFTWEWAGGANDLGALLVATDPTTYDFGTPFQILFYSTLLGIVPANAAGIASVPVTIPPGLGGLTFYSQVGVIDEITNAFVMTNVTTTVILF